MTFICGQYVHAAARAAQDASGSIEFIGAITDVTAAKEAERKLRRSEAYLAEAQQLSHTSSWAWDERRREFVYRSMGVYHIFGFDPEKGPVLLEAFRDRIHPEDKARNVEAASMAIRGKVDFDVDFRIVLPDGSIKRIHSVGYPVVDGDGDAGVARWDIATDVASEPEKWRLHRTTHDAHLLFRDFVYSTASESGSTVYVRSSCKPLFDE